MKNGNIRFGAGVLTIVLGAMIILSAHGARGEKRGITPGLTDPGAKPGRNNMAPVYSTPKPTPPDISRIGKIPKLTCRTEISMPENKPEPGIHYNMPIIIPDPDIDYKIMVMKPDPNIDYKIQVIRPNPDMFGNGSALPPKPGHPEK